MALQAGRQTGVYWQSRMGNNADGIGGNCHRYDIVTRGADGSLAEERILVDMGIKFGGRRLGYACEFASPEGVLARRDSGQVTGGGQGPAALLLTHAHEDHLGAVRHALEMGFEVPPVFASPFTAMNLAKALGNAGIERDRWPAIHLVRPGQEVTVGVAAIEFVPMDHMPGASALYIRTPEASVFHTGDYKFDDTLLLGDRADPRRLRQIGREGVDAVISDSTSAASAGTHVAEAEIRRNLTRLVADSRGRAVVVGILGSQLDRLASLAQAAKENGRALVVHGRSLAENVQTLRRANVDLEAITGATILTPELAREMPADRVLVATTGAFAQPNAGLTRAADQLPGSLCIDRDTTVIVAQRAIPQVKGPCAAMVQRLEQRGARVITAERAVEMGYGPIHQTGHAMERDARLLYTLLKPRHLVAPMHGDAAQLEANARIARDLGIQALPLERNGTIVRIHHGGTETAGHEEVRRIGAAERTTETKALPRAAPGEGRRPREAGTVYRYDELDPQGRSVVARDAFHGDIPTRPQPRSPTPAARGLINRHQIRR